MITRRNAGLRARFTEEQSALRALPSQQVDAGKRLLVRVGPSSTIRVQHNVYSVHSRLMGEQIEVRLGAKAVPRKRGTPSS